MSPCLFDLYAEYITRNARLDEAQAGIKIGGRYINNLKYADDTILMAESKEELMKVKEESGKESVMKVRVPTSPLAFSETQQIMKLRTVLLVR